MQKRSHKNQVCALIVLCVLVFVGSTLARVIIRSPEWWKFTDDVDFDPDSVPGLVLWLDASDESTLTLNHSLTTNRVQQWDDKSSNGFDVSQGTGSSQPAWIGGDTIQFSVSRFLARSDNVVNGSSDRTFMAVIKTTKSISNFVSDDGAGSDGSRFEITTEMAVRVAAGATIFTTGSMDDAYRTITVISTNGNVNGCYAWTNGVSLARSSVGNRALNTSGNLFRILGTSGSMNVREIIYYNRELSDAEMADLRAWLKTKWGL